mmetsp:Transcript_8174/g.21374  ORF Transcript_8174/g.21374 Transcript_8174/m.21374 type:complete len:237 (-) Transcript_8174:472-1182(-)
MAHLPPRGVHPCERRVDGERVTELVPAHDWMKRSDANQLKPTKAGPPALPRHAARDHLHDRNRERALYDPASPGVETYVRATRRRLPTEAAEQEARNAHFARQRNLALQQEREAAEANELLELRSMGIRTGFNARKTGQMFGSQAVVVPEANPRTQQLERKLGVDKVQLVTSPLQIDTTPPAGHNTAPIPQGSHRQTSYRAGAPAPAPAMAVPAGLKTTLRGNNWPTTEDYFRKSR